MIVRRYIVRDMPEAVMSIRKDLGKDAVILSTKKVRVKKWLGLRWQKRLEVTAAVGGDIPLHHDVVRNGVKAPAAPVREETRETPPVTRPEATDVLDEPSFGAALAGAFGAYQATAAAMQPAQQDGGVKAPQQVPVVEDVLRELASLKAMLQTQVGSRDSASVASECEGFLRAQGVGEDVARQWAQRATANDPDVPMPIALSRVQQVILDELGDLAIPMPISQESRVVAFVGPTGVGKTTSIAKIAALYVLAGKRRVGLLTTDTFRIAAVEQLKTYADILGVPMLVVDDAQELPLRLAELSGCDLILVDTAGRNFRKPETVANTQSLLGSLAPDETILVASLTAKPDDLDALVTACNPFGIDKFLFTKLDETSTVGSIPALLAKYQRPLSYVTVGQNVPDDIDILSVEQILDRWLGGEAGE
ncbi:flagellar biosynthesis protein FlhF [Alicyclobacillus suci]|uniref:flagellar biosynthesis protein FlhF n=1 Tax=Alicyclobacillus suci TaxID=2816080 RepID=UPI001A9000C5|nr:flagellar biosynthesis protein FlhF [Alicyclobacillus suci]